MKSLLLIATLLLPGCVAQHKNYIDYLLTTTQARQVAKDVATELARRYPAKTVFSFPHDPFGAFSTALEEAIRETGRGINPEVRPGLHHLTFRLTALNDHQFFISITVNQQHMQMVWSDDDGQLTRLQTITQGEVSYE